MARYFAVAGDNLTNSVAAVTVTPLTMSVWFKPPPLGTTQDVVGIVSATNITAWYLNLTATGACQVLAKNAAGSNSTVASTTFASAGAWNLLTGTFTDDTNRAAYMNAGGKNTVAASFPIGTPTAMRVSGNIASASPIIGGSLAHFAVWNIALTDQDVTQLLTNPPSCVQVANLVEYWPLLNGASPEPSIGTNNGGAGDSLTVAGTLFSPDDPFGYPPLMLGQAYL